LVDKRGECETLFAMIGTRVSNSSAFGTSELIRWLRSAVER